MLYKFLALTSICMTDVSHPDPFNHVILSSTTSKYDWKQKMYTTEVSFRFDFL